MAEKQAKCPLRMLGSVAAAGLAIYALHTLIRRLRVGGGDGKGKITVTQLWTFPIKSCAGYSSSSIELTAEGAKYDREWGIFSADTNNILTQRTHPRMKLIQAIADEASGFLSITAPGSGSGDLSVRVPLAPCDSADCPVLLLSAANIRGLDGAEVRRQGAEVDMALSKFLGCHVFLGRILTARLPKKSTLDESLVTASETILLHDFATLTVISEEGLQFVREGMHDGGINTNHFRPNIVVGGTFYPDEDSWGAFTVGKVRIRTARWCSRCIMPNVDDDGALSTKRKVSEFLKATRMARFPHRDVSAETKPMFGLSVFHSGAPATIRVGDEAVITERASAPVFL